MKQRHTHPARLGLASVCRLSVRLPPTFSLWAAGYRNDCWGHVVLWTDKELKRGKWRLITRAAH